MNSTKDKDANQRSADSNPPKKFLRSARNKMMDLLAIRDHSEIEIRKKLKQRKFTDEEIDAAITYGRDHQWLPSNQQEQQKLAQRLADSLHKKNKGIQYINHHLKQKGLPPVAVIFEVELEKAIRLLQQKQVKNIKEKAQRAKAGRLLISRGFELEVVRKALQELYEKF